jgi:hypothetical protein
MDNAKKQIMVKTYKGQSEAAIKAFQDEAPKMAVHGYVPATQVWVPGSYGSADFVKAFLLCFILIGFIVFIYMLTVKPVGVLLVTYERPIQKPALKAPSSVEEKTSQNLGD